MPVPAPPWLIGILGGGAILSLFETQTDLFGAYGIGLFIGFFGYFLFLTLWVSLSDNFTVDWFLDGRRKKPTGSFEIPREIRRTTSAMVEGSANICKWIIALDQLGIRKANR